MCPHSLHPLLSCHHTRMRVLSLTNTSTQHAHRQSWLWRHAHHTGWKNKQTQRKGNREGEWRQITGSEDQNAAEPSPPFTAETNNRPNEERTMLGHQSWSFCQLIKQTVWSQFQVNRGRPALRGLGQGQAWWMRPLSQHCITKQHRLPFKLLPVGIPKVFQQQPSQHYLTPTLWETAEGKKNFKTNRCFCNINVCSGNTCIKLTIILIL